MSVYWIRHMTNSNLIYIGSTSDFMKRFTDHTNDCYNENSPNYNDKKYKIIRECGGFEMFEMKIIDVVITDDKYVRLQTEQYYMDKFKSLDSMNTRNAIRDLNKKSQTERNYYKKNSSKINDKQRIYYNENHDKIKEKMLEYYNKNRVEINMKLRLKSTFKREAKRLMCIEM